MKTTVLFRNTLSVILILALSFLSEKSFAQSGSGGSVLANGLSFTNPSLLTGNTTDKKKGAIYLFKNVTTGIDARVTIDSLVNGATIDKFDNNNNGTGYKDAFQPEIVSGNLGMSYAVFSFSFYLTGTTTPTTVQTVNVTPIDVDGNATLHEFAKINVGSGGTVAFMGGITNILSVTKVLDGVFMGIEVPGIDKSGIDTSSYGNMFTVTKTAVSSFTVNYGMVTVVPGSYSRQFSLYMKGFAIPNASTLPVELLSFSATLNKNDNKVDLTWKTATEKNVSHFIIEKSTDGVNYSDAGLMFAYGNTTEEKSYAYADKNINTSQAGVIYYRLRTVDIDQASKLSEVRVIRISKANEQQVSIITYPNPVSNELRVTVPANWQGKKVTYEIMNNNGRIMIKSEPGSSSQTETLNISQLSPGFYLVRTTCGNETATQKIIKQ